jgi:thioredoxin reductase
VNAVDVLVVGAGPAGLTAAAELAAIGLSVVVAEREQEPGGIPRHTQHLGYGVRDLHRVFDGPTYARRLVDRALHAGADIRVGTTVLDVSGVGADLVTATGIERLTARAVVLATGTRERPRAARLVPGDRPAGVLTTGALQQFSALHHQPIGRRAVIVGAEHVSFSAVLTLRHLGCDVAAMVTPLPRHQTYAPLRWATATRHRVPVRTGVDVATVIGRGRVEAVELTDGSRIACDTVVFTGDWVPDHELARRAGCTMVPVARAPAVTSGFGTSAPGVFAIGNLVHPAETADVCALDGRAAAHHVSRYLIDDRWAPSDPIAVTAPIRWASWAAGGLTLRVDRAVTARVQVTVDGQVVATSRRRSLVPNRALHVAFTDDGAGQVSVAVV